MNKPSRLVKPEAVAMDADTVLQDKVHQVLVAHLDEQQVATALAIWASKYNGSQVSALVHFMNELGNQTGLNSDDRLALRRALYHLLNDAKRPARSQGAGLENRSSVKEQVSSIPEAETTISTRVLEERSPRSPDVIVFAHVGERMIEGAQRYGYQEFTDFTLAVKDNLQTTGLPATVCENISDWCSHKAELIHGIMPNDQLRHVVNVFYISLCEAVGPSIADAILAGAIQAVEKIPEARLFHPRQLL